MSRNVTLAVTVATFLGIGAVSLLLLDTYRQSKAREAAGPKQQVATAPTSGGSSSGENIGRGRKVQGTSSTTGESAGKYFDLGDKILLAFADDITALAERVGSWGKDNTVLQDPVWVEQTSSLLNKVEQTAVAIRSLPTFPLGCERYDSEVRRMAADISFITTYLPGGLKFSLAPRIEACVRRLVAMTATVQALPRFKQECSGHTAGTQAGRPEKEVVPIPVVAEVNAPLDNRGFGAFVPGLPSGWRDLRFGMTEQNVRGVIGKKWARHGERTWETVDWGGHSLPTLAPDGRFAKAEVPRDIPLKELKVDNVDIAFEHMSMWFFKGKLISLLIKPSADAASYADLIHRATEAYGVPPRFVQIVLAAHGVPGAFSDRDDVRDVAMWTSEDTAVMMWSFIEMFSEESRFYIFSRKATEEVIGLIAQADVAATRARQKADENRKAAITF